MIAELSASCLPPGKRHWLQWGRDQMIAELADGDTASFAAAVASMGPRSNDRGILTALSGGTSPAMLQWGRDQMIAELTYAGTIPNVTDCFNGAAIK